MKRNLHRLFFLIIITGCLVTGTAWGQPKTSSLDSESLAADIPEPPDARSELPSPIPIIYEFMGGIMSGDQDKCLVNFHVRTFLAMLFGAQMKELGSSEEQELYSYQVQVQRNEFRFLSKIMNRLAKDAKLHYSNPRFNQNQQAKIVIKIRTTNAEHEFIVYCRFIEERWEVYDYVLNNRRFSEAFKTGLGTMKITDYMDGLRPMYGGNFKFKPFANVDFGLNFKLPDFFKVKEKVSQNLLYSVSAFEGNFLMHVQGASYQKPRNLNQAAAEIRETILPFKPKLFDQWKGDIGGTEAGQVIFQFEKNGKQLFTHMVIIPLAEKLLVLNFYHSSFQLLKNLSNVRDKILDNLKFAKLAGGVGDIVIPSDDASLPGGQTPTEIQPYKDDQPPVSGGDNPPPPPDEGSAGTPPGGENVEPPPPPPPPEEEEIPPPPPEEGGDENTPPEEGPGSGKQGKPGPKNGGGEESPGDGDNPPPPPPPEEQEIPPADDSNLTPDQGAGGSQEEPPQPPPDEGGGKDVAF